MVSTKEPFQKLVCQGMILGPTEHTAIIDASTGQHVCASRVHDGDLCGMDLQRVKVSADDVQPVPGRDGLYSLRCPNTDTSVQGTGKPILVESASYKMSKSRGNVINPDDIIESYGADTLRL